MKRIVILAAAAAASLALAACSTTQQQAMAPITQAVAQGMPHCHISGSLNAGAGGLAGTGTGIAQNFTFDCPAQPWPAPPETATPSSPPAAKSVPQ